MKKYKLIILAVSITVSSLLSPLQVFAIDAAFYSANDILFYNPDDVSCVAPTAAGGGGAVTITKNPTIEKIFSSLISTPVSSNGNKALNGVQAAGVMGNMYAESGLNPSAVEGGSGAGHGLVQWSFGRWAALQSFAAQKGTPWDNLDTQLAYLTTEFNGSEKAIFSDAVFSSTTSPGDAAMRFRIIFERANPQLAHDDKRTGAATSIYNLYKDLAPAVTTIAGDSAGCPSISGAVAGSIVDTALGLALASPVKNGTNQKSDARDTYQVAKEKYNPSVGWTDCGGFVATVMISSGVDPNFAKVNTVAQLAYIRSHPEKYVVDPAPTAGSLQPGDLLYTNGHTMIYTGQAQYPEVDASLGQRVPSVRNAGDLAWMLGQSGVVSARVIK